MRSEDSVLQGTVVAQCLHSMWSLPTDFLSLHIHMAPQISMAERPLRCDVMVFAFFIMATVFLSRGHILVYTCVYCT